MLLLVLGCSAPDAWHVHASRRHLSTLPHCPGTSTLCPVHALHMKPSPTFSCCCMRSCPLPPTAHSMQPHSFKHSMQPHSFKHSVQALHAAPCNSVQAPSPCSGPHPIASGQAILSALCLQVPVIRPAQLTRQVRFTGERSPRGPHVCTPT